MKQRIVQILIREIIVDVDQQQQEIFCLSIGQADAILSCGSKRVRSVRIGAAQP